MGKSRLLRDLAAAARATGAAVVSGRAVEVGGRAPFRAIGEAVLAAGRGLSPSDAELGPFAAVLARLAPGLGRDRDGEPDGVSSLLVAEGVVRLLVAAQATRGPVLVALEDLHWADDDSLDVVEYLADQLGALPVLRVGTVRADHPGTALTLVRALGARRTASVVELSRLGEGRRRDDDPVVPRHDRAAHRARRTCCARPN